MLFALALSVTLPGCASPFSLRFSLNREDGVRLAVQSPSGNQKLLGRGVEQCPLEVPTTHLDPRKTPPPGEETP